MFSVSWSQLNVCRGDERDAQAWTPSTNLSSQLVRQTLSERVRYRIRALLHLAEAPFINETESGTK